VAIDVPALGLGHPLPGSYGFIFRLQSSSYLKRIVPRFHAKVTSNANETSNIDLTRLFPELGLN